MATAVSPESESVWSLLGADEEITSDLQALGVDVGVPFTAAEIDQAHRDGIASMLMRRQAEEIAAIAQLERSRDLEIQFIAHRYAPELERRRLRAAQLERGVQALAEQTKEAKGYVGKKKSRDVGAGTFGYRTSSPCVELKDEASFIVWAEVNAPETLRVKPTLTLAVAREYLNETELAGVRREVVKAAASELAERNTSELPPGFVKVDERHDFYGKPLPAAAIAGAKVS